MLLKRTWKHLPAILWILLLFSLQTTPTNAQQQDFYGHQVGQDMCRGMSYLPDALVNQLVNRIVEASTGFESTYILQPCHSIANCVAIVDERGRPYILYNPDFLTRIKGLSFTSAEMPSANDWNVLLVLAHEVAHHLRNHLTNPNPYKTKPDMELEADEMAGFILYKLGAPSLAIAQRALESNTVPEAGTRTHPPRALRLEAFQSGWNKAQAKYPRLTPTPPDRTPTPGDTNPALTVDTPVTYSDANAGTFVLVEGGNFDMGCTPEQQPCDSEEKPAHSVRLNSYFIGQHEVTQAQWRALMGDNPSSFAGCDQCPVEQVSWNDVQEFLQRLNARTGQRYRLPTEAEWEFAARGGNKRQGYQFAGSSSLAAVGWYSENAGGKTHPVGEKLANELGLYDMSGNVWEWCQDWYGTYPSSAQTNPAGPGTGTLRVYRGGSWVYDPQNCRVSNRLGGSPTDRYGVVGFRLARTP